MFEDSAVTFFDCIITLTSLLDFNQIKAGFS